MRQALMAFLICFVIISTAFAELNKEDSMKGAKLDETKRPSQTLIVGANENIGHIAQPGWPVIVSATMLSEEGEPIALPDNLALSMKDEKNSVISIAFEQIVRPNGSDAAQAYWIAPESKTHQLAPGRYQISVEGLQDIQIESGDLIVEVNSKADASSLGLLKIQRFLLLGQDDEALNASEELIAQDAKNADAWIAKGDIFMSKDLPDKALEAYDKASELQPNGQSFFIEKRRHDAYFRSLEQREAVSGTTQP